MTIYKYKLAPDNYNYIDVRLPSGSRILHCGYQPSTQYYQLWALVEPCNPVVTRRIYMVGTGEEVKGPTCRFINTDIRQDSHLVFHFFEEL